MSDPILDFLAADSARRVELLDHPETAAAVRQFLGDAVFSELTAIAQRGSVQDHLGVKSPPNLVFVPGVMGSLLQSDTKFGVWWLDVRTRQHLDNLGLAPDGIGDSDENNQVSAFQLDTSYEPFALAALARDDFGHRPFPYDWRKLYSQNTWALRDLILKMHETNGGYPVHIVAHSMGGLMVRATLRQYGEELWPVLGRIAFIGTPHYGSTSIAGYLKNHLWGWDLMAVMGLYLSRDTFRSLWGVLSLLPAPKGIYPGTRPDDNPKWQPSRSSDTFYVHPCVNFDLYDASAWDLDLNTTELANLQRVLDNVAAFYRDLDAWHNNPAELGQDLCDRMLMVAGVGYKTLFRLQYTSKLGGLWESMDKITDRIPGDPNRDGDGRVPLASGTLPRVRMRYVSGVHGGLTNIPAVYSDVFRWLKGEPLTQLVDTPEDALGGHLALATSSSDAPRLDGSARASGDDPGYWQLSAPDPAKLSALKSDLDRGTVPDFNLLKIL
ncbi:MAG: lipase family alpha/beta hydrolase [Candidatus Korobacteraceae bacterium]